MIKVSRYYQAVFELALAATIWGGSFTLMRWGLESFVTSTFLLWRLLIAFTLGEVLHYVFAPELFKKSHKDIKKAFFPGFFLGLSLTFQTYGLNFTTATNSGFITSLYVVLIPFIAFVFFKHKIKIQQLGFALLAFIGMGFMLQLNGLNIAKGELLTLFAALTAALQIIWVGKEAKDSISAFRFNTYQIFWSWVAILPFLAYETSIQQNPIWPTNPSTISLFAMLTSALFVSLFAFYLQVRAQQVLNTTTSSMLCLLEGPFAFIFAAFFLNERLNLTQSFGAFLILFSCFLSVIDDRPKNG